VSRWARRKQAWAPLAVESGELGAASWKVFFFCVLDTGIKRNNEQYKTPQEKRKVQRDS
jgi:hypothetical protein